jgi:osmotically-inducible protein OsmY
MALSARVRAALRANDATDGVDITIDCLAGKIALRGIVADNNEKAAAVLVSAGVPGVTAVDDQLRVMSRPTFFPSSRQ